MDTEASDPLKMYTAVKSYLLLFFFKKISVLLVSFLDLSNGVSECVCVSVCCFLFVCFSFLYKRNDDTNNLRLQTPNADIRFVGSSGKGRKKNDFSFTFPF